MSDNDLIEMFQESRNYLLDVIQPSFDVYLSALWDPMCRHILLMDTKKALYQDVSLEFPSLPSEYFPQMLFEVDDKEQIFEFTIQTYLNIMPSLNFLGACEYDGVLHDMYLSPRFEIEPWVISRYGNLDENFMSGSFSARSEYHLGIMTPIAIAYSMAVDSGYIKE